MRVKPRDAASQLKIGNSDKLRSLARIRTAFGDEALHKTTICNWFPEFKRSRVNLSDEFRGDRPSTDVNIKNIFAGRRMIETERLTKTQIQQIVESYRQVVKSCRYQTARCSVCNGDGYGREWTWEYQKPKGHGELLLHRRCRKIEEQLKMPRLDLKVAKPEKRLLILVIRDVLKINTDEDIVKSLRTQNRHIADGLNWDRKRVKVCYMKRVRNHFECYPFLEVSIELCKSSLRPAMCMWRPNGAWSKTSPLLCSTRAILASDMVNDIAKTCPISVPILGGDHVVAKCQFRSEGEPPKCINCVSARCS
ncbi:hypothetical protein EVAR_8074_1 [Eumeta japonica]|uniref:Mos1 transposase HTH domain-containing protein n=1 Tax=Eumeta variegata TaxID=151549 RepID=A0A4C1TSP8_EUMVA|nr:hypothetical protein EVAR_8074_1 [Eumeta japonica]